MKKLRFFDSLKFVRAMFVVAACVFAIVPAHAATLPAGYTELEYLESTVASSQAYINTGLNFNSNYIYEINFLQSNVHNTIMGAAIESYNKKGALILTYCSDSVCFYSSTTSASSTSIYSGLTLPNNVRHTAKYQQSTKTALLDDRNVWAASWITDENIPYNIFLFGYNTAGNAVGGRGGYLRIYSYSVKDADGVLIQNLVPARRDSDGVLGMYDLEDSNPETAFHTNAGTGEFVAGPAVPIKIAITHYNETKFAPVETDLDAAVAAVDTVVTQTMSQAQAIDTIATSKQTRPDEGCTAKYCLLVEDEDGTPHWYPIAGANGVAHNLPAGYTELQYLQSSGTQNIITDLTGFDTGNWEIYTKFMSTSETQTSYGYIVSVYGGESTNAYRVIFSGTNGQRFLLSGNNKAGSGNIAVAGEVNRVYEATVKNGSVVFDGVTYETPTQGTALANTTPLTILGGVNGNPRANARIYSVKATQDGVLRADYIPAKRNSDNALGLYDMVSGRFFTNAGTGDFTGPDM